MNSDRVRYNAERAAVQVTCPETGDIVANIPLSARQIADLGDWRHEGE
jgi:hypothetical protein